GLYRHLYRRLEARARPVHDRDPAAVGCGRRRYHLHRHRPAPDSGHPQDACRHGLFRRLGHGGAAARSLCHGADRMSARFATLTCARTAGVPVETLWQPWTAPAARAVWAAPAPSVTVEFLEADPRVGGREISVCKAEGQP